MTSIASIQQGQKHCIDGDSSTSIEAFSTALKEKLEPQWTHLSCGTTYWKLGKLL